MSSREDVVSQTIFVFRPRKTGDKTMAVGGSKGGVPGSQTHTYTKTLHQYYKPQRWQHERVNANIFYSQWERMFTETLLTSRAAVVD